MFSKNPSQVPVLHRSVVVFSKQYLPLARINLRRAVILLVKGQAESLDWGHTQFWDVRSPSMTLQVSEHIRLLRGHPQHQWKCPPVTRREVLRRDRHTCQYCGSTHKLTLDHVIPRSKGGAHTWENVVTACTGCNGRKGDRTPQAVGMVLKTQPKAPIHPAVAFADQFWDAQQRRTDGETQQC